jgi:hypothetical protein
VVTGLDTYLIFHVIVGYAPYIRIHVPGIDTRLLFPAEDVSVSVAASENGINQLGEELMWR